MYSPKISEDLVPMIYAKAKEKKKPMTKIVDDILRDGLNDNDKVMESKTDYEKI